MLGTCARAATCLLLCGCFLICAVTASQGAVATTKHNLSTSGPGPIKATTENRVCIFCHTPHGATATPLWNRTLSRAAYTVPSSAMAQWSTLKSRPQNPPDGASRLCLSCHDGTIAIGSVVNLGGAPTTISMQGGALLTAGGALAPTAPSYMGTDLSGHHPVSIEVNPSLINDKATQCANNIVSFKVCTPVPPVKLRPTTNAYGGTRTGVGVQCSSCHDAHDNVNGKFLVLGTPADSSALCSRCHAPCSSLCQ